MITEEDLKQEIEKLDPTSLELALNILKQLPHKEETEQESGHNLEKTKGQILLDNLEQVGYLGSLSDVSDLSVNYKEYLDWSDKV